MLLYEKRISFHSDFDISKIKIKNAFKSAQPCKDHRAALETSMSMAPEWTLNDAVADVYAAPVPCDSCEVV
jgi:hypothetical protein